MTLKTTILDFQLSNILKEYESYMNTIEQRRMFKEIVVKIFYIFKSLDDSQKITEIFQVTENVLNDIFMNPETKSIVEVSGHIYESIKITPWIC